MMAFVCWDEEAQMAAPKLIRRQIRKLVDGNPERFVPFVVSSHKVIVISEYIDAVILSADEETQPLKAVKRFTQIAFQRHTLQVWRSGDHDGTPSDETSYELLGFVREQLLVRVEG